MKKQYYNPDSTENFMDAKIIGGDPSGIINTSRSPHKWALPLYRLMESYTWYPEECNLSGDKQLYNNLSDDMKRAYDMALAQLIQNDSVQAKQLPEGIAPYITSPMISACLVRQAYEETNHARTYALGAEEVCSDVDRIYTMDKHEPALLRKNLAVSKMYESIQTKNNPDSQDILKIAAANQVLEELVFPGGFCVLWSFKFPGTSKAIGFVQRDEQGTHVPLFKNIFREIKNQEGIENSTLEYIRNLVKHMVNEEKIWTKEISKPLMGFSDKAIDMFIEYQGNSVLTNLGLEPEFEITDGGPLLEFVRLNSMLSKDRKKTNFFEISVGDYARNTIDEDY